MLKKISVWGREFELKIVFDCFNGEEILPEQQDSLNVFLDKAESLLSDSQAIEKYCIENSNGKVSAPIDNIFKYVIPTTIYVKRSTEMREIVILCNYRFDDENGCALLFENEELKQICSQEDL